MSSYSKKIASNTVIQLIGKAVTTTTSVFTLAIIARYLGLSSYGEYATVFAFIGFFSILADMGFYTISIKEMAAQPEKQGYAIGNIMAFRMVLALVFVVVTPLIGWLVPVYSLVVKQGILIACISSFFVLVNQIFVSLFQYHMKMDRAVVSDAASRILLLMVVWGVVYFKLSVLYLILAHVVANLAMLLISFVFSRSIISFRLQFDKQYWRYLGNEASTLGLVLILGFIYFRIDSIMLSLFSSSSDVGIYSAAYKILEILITIPAIFMGSVFPVLVKYIKDGSGSLQGAFQKSFDFMSFIALPVLCSLIVLAKPIILLLTGEGFESSAPVLQILSFAVFIIFFGTIFGNFVVAADLQKKMLKIYAVGMVINTVGNLIVIPLYSYYGAAITTVITEAVVSSMTFYVMKNHFNFNVNFKVFYKSLICSLFLAVFLILTGDYLHILIVIPVGVIFYMIAAFAVKTIDKDSLKLIMGK